MMGLDILGLEITFIDVRIEPLKYHNALFFSGSGKMNKQEINLCVLQNTSAVCSSSVSFPLKVLFNAPINVRYDILLYCKETDKSTFFCYCKAGFRTHSEVKCSSSFKKFQCMIKAKSLESCMQFYFLSRFNRSRLKNVHVNMFTWNWNCTLNCLQFQLLEGVELNVLNNDRPLDIFSGHSDNCVSFWVYCEEIATDSTLFVGKFVGDEDPPMWTVLLFRAKTSSSWPVADPELIQMGCGDDEPRHEGGRRINMLILYSEGAVARSASAWIRLLLWHRCEIYMTTVAALTSLGRISPIRWPWRRQRRLDDGAEVTHSY